MARIFSFEAMAQNRKALETLKELERGRYDFVITAASDHEEEITFFIPTMNRFPNMACCSTGGTLTHPHFAPMLTNLSTRYPAASGEQDRPQFVRSTVPARRIDSVLAEKQLMGSVSAIKMDVEGHEGPALAGAREVLSLRRPLVATEGANRDQRVASLMSELGYYHCVLDGTALRRHDAMSMEIDGFWVHPSNESRYRSSGILA